MEKNLKELRSSIDKIDDKILDLLKKRVDLAKQVGEIKRQTADDATSYMKPQRQATILRRLSAASEKVLPIEQTLVIFREIISLCLNAEALIRVAYLGPQGTYTQQAALRFFGHNAELLSVHSVPEVFREVEARKAPYGVVPIENSSEGMVSNTMDVLVNSALRIVGEIKMPVHHCLLVHPWAKSLDDVKIVIAHQQAIAQCRLWLSEHLPDVEIRITNSNARAAQETAKTPNAAVIASELNAEIYTLKILEKDIEDQPNNTTRFFVVGDQDTEPSGDDKTSLVVAAKNRPGSLYHLLGCLYKEKVDLTLLESHPTPIGDWQYNFFIDCKGHITEDRIQRSIAALKQQSSFLKILGSYPRSI